MFKLKLKRVFSLSFRAEYSTLLHHGGDGDHGDGHVHGDGDAQALESGCGHDHVHGDDRVQGDGDHGDCDHGDVKDGLFHCVQYLLHVLDEKRLHNDHA